MKILPTFKNGYIKNLVVVINIKKNAHRIGGIGKSGKNKTGKQTNRRTDFTNLSE